MLTSSSNRSSKNFIKWLISLFVQISSELCIFSFPTNSWIIKIWLCSWCYKLVSDFTCYFLTFCRGFSLLLFNFFPSHFFFSFWRVNFCIMQEATREHGILVEMWNLFEKPVLRSAIDAHNKIFSLIILVQAISSHKSFSF